MSDADEARTIELTMRELAEISMALAAHVVLMASVHTLGNAGEAARRQLVDAIITAVDPATVQERILSIRDLLRKIERHV